MLYATAVKGTVEALGSAALKAVLGYAVVFLGLFLLMVVVTIMGKIMVAAQKKQPEQEAPAAPAAAEAKPAPGTAGQIKLYDSSDRDAAMIMAIVANQMGKPLNELRFISIKEVK